MTDEDRGKRERHYCATCGSVGCVKEAEADAFAAEQREARLREALEGEWLRNHDDSCDNLHECESFGGSRRCCYPRSAALPQEGNE